MGAIVIASVILVCWALARLALRRRRFRIDIVDKREWWENLT